MTEEEKQLDGWDFEETGDDGEMVEYSSPLEPIFVARDDTRNEAREVLYSERLHGVRNYEVLGSTPEQMVEWKEEVDKIRAVLERRDLTKLDGVMKSFVKKRGAYLDFASYLLGGGWSEEALTMMAIGLWLQRAGARSKNRGSIVSGLKFLQGGKVEIADMISGKKGTSCVDIAVITNEMAKMYGVSGGVYKFGEGKFKHRVWMSDNGEISDAVFGYNKAGFFRDLDTYRGQIRKNRGSSLLIKRQMGNDPIREV